MAKSNRGKSLSSERALNRGKGCGVALLIVSFTVWNAFVGFACYAVFTGEFLGPGAPAWMGLFLIPFVGVGIFGIVLIVRMIRGAEPGLAAGRGGSGRASVAGSNFFRSDMK